MSTGGRIAFQNRSFDMAPEAELAELIQLGRDM